MPRQSNAIEIGLAAAIVTVHDNEPLVLVTGAGGKSAPVLPSGPFSPVQHRTFEIGLRDWVLEQTGLNLGYAEQLYTFGDRGRYARAGDVDLHIVSVGYLALTDLRRATRGRTDFMPWYRFLPWEDWRNGRPRMLDEAILPALADWAAELGPESEAERRGLSRAERLKLCFGSESSSFDEEKALERYELLYEAGLTEESVRDGRAVSPASLGGKTLGISMQYDHRRILATAIGRLRGKLKYRPVIFELIPTEFTLTDLQNTVEAISGRHLHKQNFRRLVESSDLVEPTGSRTTTGGRPAALFRFRREVLAERPAPGIRVGTRS